MGYLSCKSQASVVTCRSVAVTPPLSDVAPRLFSFAELESATSSFSDDALLGRGSHGAVYRAVIRHPPSVVAVKRQRHPSSELENEIRILTRIKNPRLVNVIGYSVPSSASSERLLVMEYMPNGTLFDLLHVSPNPPGWARRLRLLLQTAKAVHAVHSWDPLIIHRDIKSANVLIDSGFNARLGDFGLALSGPVRTPPAGTLGYLDPGYVTPESHSTKTDVFSFGVLLLEVISGRKAIDVAYSPPSVLEWAVPVLRKGRFLDLFDPRIPPLRDEGICRQIAYLAASCVKSAREKRPDMGDVVVCLKILFKSMSNKKWGSAISVKNPCLAVEDVEKTRRIEKKDGSVEIEDEEEGCVSGKTGCSSSSGAVHPIRSNGGRNLMDLMMGPDSETLKFIGGRPRRKLYKVDEVLTLDEQFRKLEVDFL